VPAGVARRGDPGSGDSRRNVRSHNTRVRCRIPMTGAPAPGSDAHASAATIEYVRVDHGRARICMAKQFLNGANIVTIMKQMGSKTVAQRMDGNRFRDARLFNSFFQSALHSTLIQVMAPHDSRAGIRRHVGSWKHPMPGPRLRRPRILPR
jgi:hypothetical protein